MELEPPGARILATEPVAGDARPDAPAGAEFGHLLEHADGDVEEEGKPAQHVIGVHSGVDAVFGVLDRGRERETHGFGRGRAGLLHVLTHHRDRVPVRHPVAAILHVIDENPPRAGLAQPIEHVVSDKVRDVVRLVRGAGDLVERHAPAFGHAQKEGKERERRRVVHRGGNLVDGHTVERRFHVFDRVDDRAAGAE